MAVTKTLMSNFEVVKGLLLYKTAQLFNTRAKKLFWCAACIVTFVMYFSSSRFILPHRHLQVNHGGHRRSPKCLEPVLEKWFKMMESADALVKHIPADSVDQEFLPFLGNGFIGLAIERSKIELYILNDTTMGLFKIPFQSFVDFRPMGESPDADETLVLDLTTGEIHLFTTFNGDIQHNCIVVEHTVYIHREIAGALIQEVKINNNRPVAVHGRFEVKKKNDWKEDIIQGNGEENKGFSVSYGITKGTAKHSEKIVAIASTLFAKEMKIAELSSAVVSVKTAVREVDVIPAGVSPTVPAAKKQSLVETRSKALVEDVKNDWLALQKLPLYETQKQAWEKIWKLGIRIDSKNDPDAPSPLHVNITEYYLYSLTEFEPINSTALTDLGNHVGSCYHGPVTMHSAEFWVLPRNINGLEILADKWKNSLFKYGCDDLLMRGLLGVQRAIVLSFSGLQYTKHGLELALNPISLSSNISLRRIPYQASSLYLNIRINPPDGIKTVEIHMDNPKENSLFACGSACEDIVQISNAPSVFIAKLTNPVTPILYVSSNRSDLDVINKSSFMKKAVQDSQISEHPRFAAHHFTIPAKFWIAVILSIILFHVIVIKMIYTECRKERTGKRPKNRAFKA
eukprot:gene16650-18340_t